MLTINLKTYIECDGELQDLDETEFSENLIMYLDEMFYDIASDEQIEMVEITIKQNGITKDIKELEDFTNTRIDLKAYIKELVNDRKIKHSNKKDELVNWLNTK